MKDDFTIDDILKEVKQYEQSADKVYRGTDKKELLDGGEWSMDEIDKLLSDVDAHHTPTEDIVYTPEVQKIFSTENDSRGLEIPEEEEELPIIETPEEEIEEVFDEKTKIIPPIVVGEGTGEEFYEKPGVIVKANTPDDETADGLDPMPTIIPAHELASQTREYTPVSQQETVDEDNIDGQIKIVGFETESPEGPLKISEARVEDELKKKKAEKISKFIIYSDDDTEVEAPAKVVEEVKEETPEEKVKEKVKFSKKLKKFFVIDREKVKLPPPTYKDEYRTIEGKSNIHKDLLDRLARNKKDMVILLIITVLLFLVTVIPTLMEDGFNSVFGKISIVLNILLLAGANFVRYESFIEGFKSFKKPNFTSQTVFSITSVISVIQSLIFLFVDCPHGVQIYSAIIALSMLLDCVSTHLKLNTVISNFNFMNITLRGKTYTVQRLEDKDFAATLGRGLLMDDPDIRYSARTSFASRFMELSFDRNLLDRYTHRIVPITFALSLIIGIISGIVSKSVLFFFTSFSCALCLSVPLAASLSFNISLRRTNKKLNDEGAMISGYTAALESGNANSIVVDASSLFLRNECNLHGMKNFGNMRLDDIILYSAAMMIEADGPLAKVFKRVIMDKEELLPEVQDLTYEDKLGLSGWINNQRAFLGNREMLKNHNIEVPAEISEAQYTVNGRKVMYLAVGTTLAAMFVVSYKSDDSLVRPLRILDSNGISILVRTNDVNITEVMLAEEFGVSVNSIKILNYVAGNAFKEKSMAVKSLSLASIVHDGSSKSFLRSVASASVLSATSSLTMTLQLVSIVLGLLLTLLFVCMSSLSFFGPIQLTIFTAVWIGIMMLIHTIKK